MATLLLFMNQEQITCQGNDLPDLSPARRVTLKQPAMRPYGSLFYVQ
ncbi:hypothetical protein K5D34_06015 [Pseudomonas cichorii]|nr:hypothetical protein [Pseudomonas cichorii]MBX8489480.1 hypothetical protein [Pseudomonas cichorii]MBX8509245.1 hypothetical protein [Pseudomonas cichorii]MBX8521582.1 hypothetical protein [Pseudomonas cichorii]MBX8524104.1 hypothetical protein [Pseudomonas cichorii]MBX8541470.1 hypothetical protein [Pseudomonas cichorii]